MEFNVTLTTSSPIGLLQLFVTVMTIWTKAELRVMLTDLL